MNLFFELIPIVAFFTVFKLYDIYAATFTAIALAIAQILFLWMIRKKVTAAQYAGLALILIFGGLTILLKDEIFIKLKPSILYALFAIVLLGSSYIYKINLIEKAMSKEISLNPISGARIWHIANLCWILFFCLMSALNLFIALNFSDNVWATFKLSSIGLLVLFVIGQSIWLSKYIEQK